MDWKQFALLASFLGLGAGGVAGQRNIADELRQLRESLQQVALSLAVATSKLEDHERRISRLEPPFGSK